MKAEQPVIRVMPVAPAPQAQIFQTHGVSGKLSAPVSPPNRVYAHFRHIVGVSAPEGLNGVSLYKLRILDNLIESYLKTQKPQGLRSEDIQVPVSRATVDATLAAVSADYHDALLSRPQAQTTATGILVDLAG